MTTVTIKLPQRQAKYFRKVSPASFLRQCVADYVESKQDKKLKKSIENDDEISAIADKLASKL